MKCRLGEHECRSIFFTTVKPKGKLHDPTRYLKKLNHCLFLLFYGIFLCLIRPKKVRISVKTALYFWITPLGVARTRPVHNGEVFLPWSRFRKAKSQPAACRQRGNAGEISACCGATQLIRHAFHLDKIIISFSEYTKTKTMFGEFKIMKSWLLVLEQSFAFMNYGINRLSVRAGIRSHSKDSQFFDVFFICTKLRVPSYGIQKSSIDLSTSSKAY